MPTWVTTVRALSELSTGGYPDLEGLGASEPFAVIETSEFILIYHRTDSRESRLVLVNDVLADVPLRPSLTRFRARALERMVAAVQRTAQLPIVIPHNWGSFRNNDLVEFYALPAGVDSGAPRWVIQVGIGKSEDVAFWELTEPGEQIPLEPYVPPATTHSAARAAWESQFDAALAELLLEPETSYDLARLSSEQIAAGLTVSQWQGKLTQQQRQFVDAPTAESIRLRGPAGSGKTLALAVKAVREAQASAATGRDTKILYLTHSWSLASEVAELVEQLSEAGRLDSIDVAPLLTLAQDMLPSSRASEGLTLIGEDSLSAKESQLAEIEEVISVFTSGDWLTYRSSVSESLRSRIESSTKEDTRGLAWDCLIEFGCVLGADGIFPGIDAERRYLHLPRAAWMMPLETDADKRVIFAIYEMFFARLEERGLLSSDQLVNDFLNYLETFAWRRRRVSDGYDLVFVDEFHLFNVQERQILKYLNRDPNIYPRVFMALDPRQSPWEVFVGRSNVQSGVAVLEDERERSMELTIVHRSSPQILDFIKHIHLDFPSFDLGAEWYAEIDSIRSSAVPGPKPTVSLAPTRNAETTELYRNLVAAYSRNMRGQIALAVVDPDQFTRYLPLVAGLNRANNVSVSVITGRDDLSQLKHRKRGIIVAPAEYLAGLQFQTVYVAGVPPMVGGLANQGYKKRQSLSLLYLAASRAREELHLYGNEDDGGLPEVVMKAVEQQLCTFRRLDSA